MATSEDVLVVGGGFSGLSCALSCASAGSGAVVKLLEAEGSLCGHAGRAALHRSVCQRSEIPDEALGKLNLEFEGENPVLPSEVLKSLTKAVMSEARIQVFTHCTVTRLLFSATTGACGCVYRDATGQEISVQGKVILCCGGILSDVHPAASLLAKHRPDLLHLPIPLGLGPSNPSLLRHVVDLGAQMKEMHRGFRLYATAEASSRKARRLLPHALRGQLLCSDGEVHQNRSEDEIAKEILQRGPCWLVRGTSHPSAPRGVLRQVLLQDLAQEMQVPCSRLIKVLEGAEVPKETTLWVVPVTPVLLCCEGGLAVEGDSGRVMSEEGPIPGLFAAGEAAAGSGSSMSSCVSSALRAAAAALAAPPVPCGRDVAVMTEARAPDAPELSMPPDIPEPKLHQRLALSRLDRFLKSKLTAETLQAALLRSLKDQRFESALEELILELSGGLTQEVLQLELRDPAGLPTRPMLAALPEASGVVSNSQASATCVHCRLPLKFQVTAERNGAEAKVNGNTSAKPIAKTNGKGFAYATLLYGTGVEYFLGALVLGWSLQANGCREERLLLHTEDVPEVFLDALQTYWTLRKVEYLNAHRSLYCDKDSSRFQAVFTKIQVLTCTDYSKVLMMDLDMLVRGNLDELFQLRAPAALKRCSGREQPEHGADYVSEDFFKPQGEMGGGMNAGVMLLEPNMAMYHRMCREIEDPKHPEHQGSYTPEQDYLGRFYGAFGRGKWTHLHAKFNYQPNLPDDYVGSAHKAVNVLEDVMVAHYSGGRVKPWKIPQLRMNVTGVRRLLEEEDLKEEIGRSNYNGNRPARTNTVFMDGVSVEKVSGPNELPADVRQLMWEWVVALRQCNQELLEDGIDILTLIESCN